MLFFWEKFWQKFLNSQHLQRIINAFNIIIKICEFTYVSLTRLLHMALYKCVLLHRFLATLCYHVI